jgi:OmpA family protein
MLKPLIALVGAALLVGACSETQAVQAPPPPPVQTASFMVFFDWDRSDVSQVAMNTIRQAADNYRATGVTRISTIGHADTSGPRDYNMALSLRRANAVKNALIEQGVPATAIAVSGRGEDEPLVPTGDGVREPQNRRVVIQVGDGTQASMVGVGVFRDPATYCKALSDKYREYRRVEIRPEASAAEYQCQQGKYSEGIPVLEDGLIKDNIPLPAPGYRWPGDSWIQHRV